MLAAHTRGREGWAGWAALVYLAFPIYGSLLPFEWRDRDPGEALQTFLALLAGPLHIDSRPDFAANLLLALPLALLLQGALGRRLWTAPLVWALCTLLAALLEGTQLFFSGRNPALSDVLAQSCGALLGVVAAGFVPAAFWQRSQDQGQGWRKLLALYLAGLVLYALMPLDLSSSPSDLLAKWREGKVRLLPFQGWGDELQREALGSLLDVGLWALAGWLTARAHPRCGARGLLALLGLAALLELAQLLVRSRTSDTTDLIAALLGLLLATRLPGPQAAPSEPGLLARWGVALAASTVLLLAATWPWEMVASGAALRARLDAQVWLPFASYAVTQELALVTNLLRRLFAFVLLALAWRWALRPAATGLARGLLLALPCVLLALLIEGLQLGLRAQVSDLGDAVLAALCAIGVGLWRGGAAPAEASAPRRPSPARAWTALGLALLLSLGIGGLPGLPYNLRELFGGYGGLAAPAILFGLFALPASAAWLAQAADPARPGAPWVGAQLPLAALLLALWLLLWAPTESLHDVVGYPTLGLGAGLEVGVRLFVLLLGPLWALSLGLCSAWPDRRAWQLALHGVWVLPLWHGVVVLGANTDNLVELMAGGGSLTASLCGMGYAALLGVSAGWLWGGAGWRRLAALLPLPLLGWALAQAGTESLLIKYGQAFSALQFLLSEDRAHYARGAALWLRFALAHGLLLAGCWAALVWLATLCRWPRPAGAPGHRPAWR